MALLKIRNQEMEKKKQKFHQVCTFKLTHFYLVFRKLTYSFVKVFEMYKNYLFFVDVKSFY